MSWQVSLLIFFVLLTALSILQRHYSQKTTLPESVPPALAYLFGVTPIGIILGLLLPHHIHWSAHVVLLLIIEGLFIGTYNKLSFRAMSRLPLAQYLTLYQSYEIVVIALGWSFLREGLTVPEIIGASMLLAGALFAVRAPVDATKERRRIHMGAVYLTLFTALVMGTGLAAEKGALQYMTIGAYFIFGFFTQSLTICSLALYQMRRQKIKRISPYDLKRSAVMGVLTCCVGLTYIYAIVHSNNVSLITALSAFTLPLSVLAAYLILHEREHMKVLGMAIALSCIGLIISALH